MEGLVFQIIGTAVLLLYPTWRIFKKAGLTQAFSLFVLIPSIGILICGLILIFSKWNPTVAKESN